MPPPGPRLPTRCTPAPAALLRTLQQHFGHRVLQGDPAPARGSDAAVHCRGLARRTAAGQGRTRARRWPAPAFCAACPSPTGSPLCLPARRSCTAGPPPTAFCWTAQDSRPPFWPCCGCRTPRISRRRAGVSGGAGKPPDRRRAGGRQHSDDLYTRLENQALPPRAAAAAGAGRGAAASRLNCQCRPTCMCWAHAKPRCRV